MNKRVKVKTKSRSWFVQKLIEMGACRRAIKYAQRCRTFSVAWNSCSKLEWQKWLLEELALLQHRGIPSACPSCRIKKDALLSRFPADRVAKALRKWKA